MKCASYWWMKWRILIFSWLALRIFHILNSILSKFCLVSIRWILYFYSISYHNFNNCLRIQTFRKGCNNSWAGPCIRRPSQLSKIQLCNTCYIFSSFTGSQTNGQDKTILICIFLYKSTILIKCICCRFWVWNLICDWFWLKLYSHFTLEFYIHFNTHYPNIIGIEIRRGR